MTQKYKKIVVFSGAGIDAESGISTFRDANGLWENHRIEDVCSFHTWEDNYDLVHKFYDDRREQLGTVFPNVAHTLVSYWQKKYTCLNITTNVSDLFERAGVKDTVHLHGFLPEVKNVETGKISNIGYSRSYIDNTFSGEVSINSTLYSENYNSIKNNPECKFKPNIVFFGEDAPKYDILYRTLSVCDKDTIVIVVGASNVVIDFIGMTINLPSKLIVIDKNPNLMDRYNPHSDTVFLSENATDGMLMTNFLLNDLMEL